MKEKVINLEVASLKLGVVGPQELSKEEKLVILKTEFTEASAFALFTNTLFVVIGILLFEISPIISMRYSTATELILDVYTKLFFYSLVAILLTFLP